MRIEHESWRLKGRALWVKQGDCNSRFFQKFTNHRKNQNSIWGVKDAAGLRICSQDDLEKESVCHFEHIFKDLGTWEI